MSDLRTRLHRNEPVLGTLLCIPSPSVVEMFGSADLDFIGIEAEHASVSRDMLDELVRAGDVAGKPFIIRVPTHEADWIASALDAGAAGIVVPRIDNAEQAKAAVSAFRLPPLGKRGIGPSRATGYGQRLFQYVESANDTLVLALMIETVEGLVNLEDILSVPGFDAIVIGPGDLSLSLGAFGQAGSSKFEEAVSTIVETCKARGVAVGQFLFDMAGVEAAIDRGMTFLVLPGDIAFIQTGMATAYKNIDALRARGEARR